MLDPVVGFLIIGGVALLLALAGGHKLRSLAEFTEVFAAYRLLPDALARRTAWLIPCAELAIAAALLWPRARGAAIAAAIVLLLAYASGMSINLARGRRELDCGCGPAGNRRAIAAWMVWRNVLLSAFLGVAALPWISRPYGPSDLVTGLAGFCACIALYAAADRLLGEIAPKGMILRGIS